VATEAPRCQVLIASYEKDFQWLIHCLGSLKRFSKGFLPPKVCVEAKDELGCREIIRRAFPEAECVVKDGRPSQGFMRAQCSMLSADILCPESDVVFLLGSDSFAAGEFRPEPYFADGRPLMLYTSYKHLNVPRHDNALPWRQGVQRILGWEPEAEYMRRLPLLYPRSIFAPFRAFVADRHHADFEDIIYRMDRDGVKVSESNMLGAWAWKYSRDSFYWVDTETCRSSGGELVEWPSKIFQFWSHGGLDRITEAHFWFDGKCSKGRTPREILNHILYDIPAK
jgi:hypothetical protein